jgi:hypothetical protein
MDVNPDFIPAQERSGREKGLDAVAQDGEGVVLRGNKGRSLLEPDLVPVLSAMMIIMEVLGLYLQKDERRVEGRKAFWHGKSSDGRIP